MSWLKKKNDYAYSISVHQTAVHLAILKAVADPVAVEKALPWQGRYWELVVNDDIAIVHQDVAGALQQLLKRYAAFPTKKQPLQLVLGSGLVHEGQIDKPELSDADITATLQWTLKDLVPIPANDLVVDFYDAPIQLGNTKKIHVVAASRTTLTPILNVLHAAKFEVQGIVNANLAFRYWFEAEEQLVLLSQSVRAVNELQIFSRNRLILSRELNRVQPLTKIDVTDMAELSALALEVQRSLDFYSGQLRQAPLTKFYLATAHPQAGVILDNLGAQLGLQGEMLRYPSWTSELKSNDMSDLAVLAGLLWLTRATNSVSAGAA